MNHRGVPMDDGERTSNSWKSDGFERSSKFDRLDKSDRLSTGEVIATSISTPSDKPQGLSKSTGPLTRPMCYCL